MSSEHIPFNKPYLTGKETEYIQEAVLLRQLSGNGSFTKKSQKFFEKKYDIKKCLLTTSCTDALEMIALLLNIKEGDEVIMPSFTFVSTANAFAVRGAKIVFVDSGDTNPNIDPDQIEALVTSKTKVIVVVHYAGIACDMDKIMSIAEKYGLLVVEDAAQSIDSYYKDRPLGAIGDLSAFSFHETKNIISGEGGMLAINNEKFIDRAEVLWEKGTNRAAFFRGEVQKYQWVDLGSSFLPSEIIAAFLYAQIENLDKIQKKRIKLWNAYHEGLKNLEGAGLVILPKIYSYSTNNGHLFYLICNSENEREQLIAYLESKNINAVFHYLGLHNSPYYKNKHDGRNLPNCDKFSACLLRLPLFYELTEANIERVVLEINNFYKSG